MKNIDIVLTGNVTRNWDYLYRKNTWSRVLCNKAYRCSYYISIMQYSIGILWGEGDYYWELRPWKDRLGEKRWWKVSYSKEIGCSVDDDFCTVYCTVFYYISILGQFLVYKQWHRPLVTPRVVANEYTFEWVRAVEGRNNKKTEKSPFLSILPAFASLSLMLPKCERFCIQTNKHMNIIQINHSYGKYQRKGSFAKMAIRFFNTPQCTYLLYISNLNFWSHIL